MKRPYIHFYVGDWTANSKLRRCSFHERGIWMDVLCLLHDSDEVGILRWPLKDLAQAVGCKESDLKSLAEKEVLRGANTNQTCPVFIFEPKTKNKVNEPVVLIPEQMGPIWFSSRMVIDEYKRAVQAKNSPFQAGNVVKFEPRD